MESSNNDLWSSCRTPQLIAAYEELYHVPEAVVSGVEPQEMDRFCEAFIEHQEAEEAMWFM